MKVRFYGRLADLIAPELEVETSPGWSIAQLRDRLATDHPEASQVLRGKRSRACVGDALVHDNYVLQVADRVEFLPPVSGG